MHSACTCCAHLVLLLQTTEWLLKDLKRLHKLEGCVFLG
jgi:hypothetical protein